MSTITSAREKNKRILRIAFLSAIVVVLQYLSNFIKVGNITLTFSLVPIVIGAVLFGPRVATILGAVFGAMTYIGCVTALDAGGYILFASRPFMTLIVCILKGVLCALCAALLYKLIRKVSHHVIIPSIIAAAICPIVNTATFCIFMFTCYNTTLTEWAGGKPILSYMIVGLAGVNFIVEFFINIVLVPIIAKTLSRMKTK